MTMSKDDELDEALDPGKNPMIPTSIISPEDAKADEAFSAAVRGYAPGPLDRSDEVEDLAERLLGDRAEFIDAATGIWVGRAPDCSIRVCGKRPAEVSSDVVEKLRGLKPPSK
jgi:hypothetical protein